MKSQEFVDKVLEKYPAKVMKNRKKHIVVRDTNETQEISANTRAIPGIITNRGCCYAGCKGVVVGPIIDMVHIVHGPIGCSYYAWNTRRNKGKKREDGKNFLEYCFSTDMQESDIVFGGEKKLAKAIDEAVELFNPVAISISATCPVGLIGDDINQIAKLAQKRHGIPVLAFNCEGYKGVSQSAGHHIANNNLMRDVIGTNDNEVTGKYKINILGEYNIGGDEWEIARILSKVGYNVVTTMTGNSTYEEIARAHQADLNLVQCHRSINYIAEMIEIKYGSPWMKVNFIGIESMSTTLRHMAKYFGDEELMKRTEEVIEEETQAIEEEIASYKEKCEGKTAVLFVGGSRAHHYQGLLKEIGIDTIVAGYEFGHRDDYEGRDIIPDIKLDADTRNIEEITVEKDEQKYKLRIPEEKLEALKQELPINNYEGMIKEMGDGTVLIDDLNHFETEMIIKAFKPDFFGSGVKDKYMIQKMGVYSKQMHSYDYSGPYAGYKGALNFARDVTAGIHTPAWQYVMPPWKKEPILSGKLEEGAEKVC
ncbi:Mo-nitrogenase MoFe protein subunit NifD precursor [Natranaerovirga hydrolytica]|uniref:Nitrogenase molybdenum-iron protein alpha chain n=1 Tax=Natranaerovirga hydrolytica TaxID=680378 RepID=A0A4R1MM05_9FIRM|nr:nitrogenase molybdenum-iron protein alpha chain [Natranaerovirga hydrolytica]TCK92902.1 Mo-nitrogenase MoFe protein subunit NifD precursor [Natranaerovirga hydrolytica]